MREERHHNAGNGESGGNPGSTAHRILLICLGLMLPPTVGSLGAESIPRQEGYLEGSLIYTLEARPTPQCHASTLAETSEGLVAAWFGGTHEKHPDVGIWLFFPCLQTASRTNQTAIPRRVGPTPQQFMEESRQATDRSWRPRLVSSNDPSWMGLFLTGVRRYKMGERYHAGGKLPLRRSLPRVPRSDFRFATCRLFHRRGGNVGHISSRLFSHRA